MKKYKFGENLDKKKSDWVRISFTGLSRDQLKHIRKAERELLKAGVRFDMGIDAFDEEERVRDLVNFHIGNVSNGKRRVWELDWSLRGAQVQVKKKK